MKIGILHSDAYDWVGLYVNGKLLDQGHSLTIEMILDALGLEYKSIEKNFEDIGTCPETWEEAENL